MRAFQVLEDTVSVYGSYFLEASAGTGKTFSIEHLVVRALIETPPQKSRPAPIERILVVTFTRAAARELRMRIRQNIEKSLIFLSSRSDNAPPYLRSIMERGEEAVSIARGYLEQALYHYDLSAIFTIHGFCHRTLKEYAFEGELGLNSERELGNKEQLEIVKDFLRTKAGPDSYSPAQFSQLLKWYSGDIDKLTQALCQEALKLKQTPVAKMPFSESFKRFQIEMIALRERYPCVPEKVLEDFFCQAGEYKEICNQKGEAKQEIVQKIERFSRLFSQEQWSVEDFNYLLQDGLLYVDLFHPDKRKKRVKAPSLPLHYPDLYSLLDKHLQPLVKQTRHPLKIFSRMAQECRELLDQVMADEELFNPDQILQAMQQTLQNSLLVARIQALYDLVIVDEFQDTDPIQWEIFSTLFATSHPLILVGDPKQSIYAFRNADIYCYMNALQLLGEGKKFSLNINFRSKPELIEAINCLFADEHAPGILALPRLSASLPYQPVQAGVTSDQAPSARLHFFAAEGHLRVYAKSIDLERHLLFPYIVCEIQRLHREEKFSYAQCAILVADRYQAERVRQFLRERAIPSVARRKQKLVDLLGFSAVKELLCAIIDPTDHSKMAIALGGALIGWTHDQIVELQKEGGWQPVLTAAYPLKEILFNRGFAAFCHAFLASSWGENQQSVLQQMLQREGGHELWRDLQQITEIIVNVEQEKRAGPDRLLLFLNEVELAVEEDDEKFQSFSEPDGESVQILTLHASKGLEFGVVFALAVAFRSKSEQDALMMEEDPQAYTLACRERDAEKARQLYVAMTRAKEHLYLPLIVDLDKKPLEQGTAAPLELLFARHKGKQEDPYLHLPINSIDEAKQLFQALACDKITFEALDTSSKCIFIKTESESRQLRPPQHISLQFPTLHIHSFSSLALHGSTERKNIAVPPDSADKSSSTLPPGPECGQLLHRALEIIPWETLCAASSSAALTPLLGPILKHTLLEEWEEVVAEMLYNALHAPLKRGDNAFTLADVPADRLHREMEFLFEGLPGDVGSSGLMKGVIDLFFEREGFFYIVDWKSNWLEGYSQPELEKEMRAQNYFLQAQLYREALIKYLRLFKGSYGGAFYLFLRGIDPVQSPETGIYEISVENVHD